MDHSECTFMPDQYYQVAMYGFLEGELRLISWWTTPITHGHPYYTIVVYDILA